MAIVSVSRIQHRRGLIDDLPQLASAELGWAINSRRLFIGNGTETEGAPEIGNTEILTEYSDIISLLNAYTYQGARGGYVVSTGPDANSPVVRTFQDKFDDIVNVRDFGVSDTNDAATNTAAINRALYQLFCRGLNTAVRRVLYFPAGVYSISGTIKIPTWATVIGDGLGATIILQTDINYSCVQLADSLQQVDLNNGSGAGVSSRYIDIRDMTFKLDRPTTVEPDGSTIVDVDICLINFAQSVRFSRVGFEGYRNVDGDVNDIADARAGVKLNYTANEGTINDVLFDNCEFKNTTYAATINENVTNVRFNNCNGYHLFKGFLIGDESSIDYPTNINFQLGSWDKIYGQAIISYANVVDVTSAFNKYLDVGMGLAGASYSTPVSPVIDFQEEGGASFCDSFARSDIASLVYPRVEFNGNSIFQVIPSLGLTYGFVTVAPSGGATLADNTVAPTSTGIVLNLFNNTTTGANINGADVTYRITRADQVRYGSLRLVQDASNQSFDEDYIENNGDIGVNFGISYGSNATTVTYTTTSIGDDATLHYQMRYLT